MRILLLIILGFVSPALAFNYSYPQIKDFFYDHISNYLDHSISPCHDFYEHVCPIGKLFYENDTFLYQSDQLLLSLLNKSNKSVYFQKIVNLFEKLMKEMRSSSTSRKNIKKEVEDYCTKINPERCIQFNAMITENPLEINISFSSEDFIYMLQKRLTKYRNQTHMELMHYFDELRNLDEIDRLLRALDDHPAVKKAFNLGQLRNEKTFHKLVQIYNRSLQNTPWVKERGLQQHFQSILNVKYEFLTVGTPFEHYFREVYTKFKECSEVLFGWDYSEIFLCLNGASRTIRDKYYIPFFLEYGIYSNAMYTSGSIYLNPGLIGFFIDDPLIYLATIGNAIGHELGHHIFTAYEGVDSYTADDSIFMPENIKCLKQHRERLCQQSQCHSGEQTAGEDAPDVTGLAAVLEQFEIEKNELQADLRFNLTKEQLFFYSFVAMNCAPPNPNRGIHSITSTRFNALLTHSQTFHNAFGCKKGDRMFDEPDNFCNLLGPESIRR